MRKPALLLIFLLQFLLISCISKKDRLTSDTLDVRIDPPAVVTVPGTSVTLKVIARSAKADNVDVKPQWSFDNTSIGNLTPGSEKTAVFAATSGGTGNITVICEGVRNTVPVSVVSNSQVYGIFSETYTSPVYASLKYDTANPPDPDGGCLGAWDGAIGNLADVAGYEGATALQCSPPISGGWWIQFGSDNTPGFGSAVTDPKVEKDLSAFAGGSLKFAIKTNRNISIKIEWVGGSGSNEKFLDSLPGGPYSDNNWHVISIPLADFTGIDLSRITVPSGFHASIMSTVYTIDDVRWEK